MLVFLPGGPGGSSTDSPPAFIPAEWGYLLTDPRGVGCNTLAEFPDDALAAEFYRTSEIAADTVAAIQTLGPQRYVLFGVSYGTLLGTTVAASLQEQGVSPPQAVVLEGVLGRAFPPDFAGAEFIRQWERIRPGLPADVLTELDTQPSPYGLSPEEWSRILISLMPVSPTVTAQALRGLSSSVTPDPATREATVQGLKKLASPEEDPAADLLYRWVACREITNTTPENQLDVVFSMGRLVRNSAEEGTLCRELSVTTPFDSAAWQFAAPVYYFIGEDDVSTPAWQGNYAYSNHQGKATRIITATGGHNSLRLNQMSCAPQVMASIAAGAADLIPVLATCPLQAQVDSK
ncbi:alpha/beta fold hydrolase [Stigmatella erecta]|uniref:alpha/beta fold hydrolase n=1 Tax=Stigmatella erecta TaxID=83460 RepID=UPI0015A73342|nr:alpha/beta fold hydrolase [Stigmatella erecta]